MRSDARGVHVLRRVFIRPTCANCHADCHRIAIVKKSGRRKKEKKINGVGKTPARTDGLKVSSRASRRSDVAVATPHLVIAEGGVARKGESAKLRERRDRGRRGERERHRGVRARVLAQSISQPVANVAWLLGTFSPRGAIGLSECRIVFARAECPSPSSLFTTAPSVGSATLSRAGARARTNRRAGVRDWRRVKEVC